MDASDHPGPGGLLAARPGRGGRLAWRVGVMVLVAGVALPAAGAVWAMHVSRDSVTSRARQSELATARTVGDQVGLVLRSFDHEALAAGAAPGLAADLADGRSGRLAGDLAELDSALDVCAVRVVDLKGLVHFTYRPPGVVGCPRGALSVPGASTLPGSSAFVSGQSALEQVTSQIRGRGGRLLGSVQTLLPMADLVASFDDLAAGARDRLTLVGRDDRIYVTSPARYVGTILASPASQALVAANRPGSALYYAVRFHEPVIAAYYPIPGEPFGMFVSVPQAVAYAPANQMARDLLAGLAVTALLGAVLAGAITRHVRRSERLAAASRAVLAADARTDALTGLANRRVWDERLPGELARSARTGTPLAVAMLDLDHFKDVNDRYGHATGDLLLSSTARAWTGRLRAVDLLCRHGGEEFAVALAGCGAPEARDVLTDLLALVPDGHTCSAGVAVWDGHESAAEVVRRADMALYDAKRAGRNRVVVADRLRLVPPMTASS